MHQTGHYPSRADTSNNTGVQQKNEKELRGATKLHEMNYQLSGKHRRGEIREMLIRGDRLL